VCFQAPVSGVSATSDNPNWSLNLFLIPFECVQGLNLFLFSKKLDLSGVQIHDGVNIVRGLNYSTTWGTDNSPMLYQARDLRDAIGSQRLLFNMKSRQRIPKAIPCCKRWALEAFVSHDKFLETVFASCFPWICGTCQISTYFPINTRSWATLKWTSQSLYHNE